MSKQNKGTKRKLDEEHKDAPKEKKPKIGKNDEDKDDEKKNDNKIKPKRVFKRPDKKKNSQVPLNPLIYLLFADEAKGKNGKDNNNNTKPPSPTPVTNECNNPLCNHMTFDEDPTILDPITLSKISNITDLITLGKAYHCKKNKEFNGINLRLLCNLIPPLTELHRMVGMKEVKEQMVNQILFFLQGFNKKDKCGTCKECAFNIPCVKNTEDMLHTVITGPPGVGKTELGKILAKVYKEMGILSKGTFRVVSRSDLIGKYLGHTAAKTQEVINECQGGVMFIDEAYSLGNEEGRDSFSKECLDTLNQNLSEKRDFLCIIAGYKEQLEKCFFNYNDGLRRRFTFRYDIKGYDGKELRDIFLTKVRKNGWTYEDLNVNQEPTEIENENQENENYKKLSKFFKKSKDKFPNYGGDMETLFLNAKIIHSNRMVFGEPDKRRVITLEDMEEAIKKYLKNRKYDEKKKKGKTKYETITTSFYG